ncbi:hypothetical protein [Streptomyces sp. SID13031]|uniref:hypothetical protein n=1 Tax=Streptomyces sp. SID13031 TaxID=2706046 RepID=UPI0013CB1E42|nr:hypothetical protein [Streptomyces sp. SID13031]NEA30583.1 hypothetical protein [Streptomyces sp. SID13031]
MRTANLLSPAGTQPRQHRKDTPMIAFLIPVLFFVALIPMVGLRVLAHKLG